MEQKVLEIILELKDQMSDKIKDVATSSEKSFDRIQKGAKVAAVASAAVFGATLAIATKAVTAYTESQVEAEKYANALTKIADFTENQKDQTDSLINSLAKKGVVDDDAIKMGATKLAQMGLEFGAIQKLIPLVTNLGVTQSGVNVSGDELASISEKLGKAFNGNIKIFSEMGIALNQTQENIIKYGNQAEKSALMTELLGSKITLTSEQAAQTFEGRMKNLNNTLDDTWKAIGAALLPVVELLAVKLIPIIQRVTEWIQANPELTARILLVVAAVSGLVFVIASLAAAIVPIITALGMAGIGGAALVAVAAIGGMVASIIIARDQYVAAFRIILDNARFFGNMIGEAISSPIRKIINDINTIKGAAESAFGAVSRIFGASGNRQFADGGWVYGTGPATVHDGEYVLSNDMLSGRTPIDSRVSGSLQQNNQSSSSVNNSISLGEVHVHNEVDLQSIIRSLSFNMRYNSGSAV